MNILLYIYTLVAMLVLDGIWLASTANILYKKQLAHLFSHETNFIPAVIFYPLYAFAAYWFVVLPGVKDAPLISLFLRGALFGLAAYGAYDLTNQATMKNWPVAITVIDMLWGAIATGLTCVAAVFIFREIDS